MAKQNINIGTVANDGTGDPIRTAFTKVNQNFTEVYDTSQSAFNQANSSLNIAQSAYNYANTIVSDTQTDPYARTTANLALQRANASFSTVNNVSNTVNSLSSSLNSILENPQFDYAQVTNKHFSTGNIVTFTKLPDTNDVDMIDGGLNLTRAIGNGGIYNSAVEESFNKDVSPLNTEWNWSGWDNLDNVHERHYRTFTEALRKKVGSNIVGAELVMHDLTNDRYYKIKFTQWDIGGIEGADGSFEYTRELIDTNNKVGVIFPDNTNQTTAYLQQDWPVVYLDNDNYTLRLIDANRILRSYDMTIFIPRDSDVNFPIGTKIEFITETIGINIERVQYIGQEEAEIWGSGFGAAYASWNIPEHSYAILIKADSNTWYLSGVNINPI